MLSTRFTKSFARTALVAGALGLAAFVGAGAATASSADDTFIAGLKQQGFTGNAMFATNVGQSVCIALDKDHQASKADVVNTISTKMGMSTQDATTFATLAVQSYCPQYASQLS